MGTDLANVSIKHDFFRPDEKAASRGQNEPILKMLNPIVETTRGAELVAPSQMARINGIALDTSGKPVNSVTINGMDVKYDRVLHFFDTTITLAEGVNSITVNAKDDSGNIATSRFDMELKSELVTTVQEGKNYFLGIGINQYISWPKLNNAVRDIYSFDSLLRNRFGYNDSTITLLLDSNATKSRIVNTIRSYIRRASPNDNIIIYFSGHGNEDPDIKGNYYFIPQEGDKSDVNTYCSSYDIIKAFENIKARHCVLVMDACYSGMITNVVDQEKSIITSSDTGDAPDKLPSKWIITSGTATKVSDGIAGTNSPFAKILIGYLKDHSDPESLKVSKLIDYLVNSIPKSEEQVPLGKRIQGRGEIIFKVVH